MAWVGGDERAQGPPGLPLIGRVVADLQRDQLALAERQVHPARPDLLQLRQQMGVERGLRDRAGLGGPGELGVHDLVVQPARARLPVRRSEQAGADQEIRPPQQRRPAARRLAARRLAVRRPAVRAAAQQHALINDVSAAADSLARGLRCRCLRARRRVDRHDLAAVRTELLQHDPLVLLAPLHQVLEPDVEPPWPVQPSPGFQQIQPGHVLARHEVRHIARGQPEPVLSKLHAAPRLPWQVRYAPYLSRLRRARQRFR